MNKLATRALFTTSALLAGLAPGQALADEGAALELPGASAEITLDYVTNYFFRGYEQGNSDSGVNIQTGASVTLPVYEDSITATIGTWASFQTNEPPTGIASTSPADWYEQDVYGSVDASFGKFSAGAGITLYTYPGGAGGDIIEVNLSLAFDDSEYLGDFALNPYVAVALETNNNFLVGSTENDYLEIGGAFSLDPLTEGTFAASWTWEVPIVAGFSLNSYYADASGSDEFFGYATVGLAGSTPLADLIGYDEWFGAWDLNVGVTLLIFNGDAFAQSDNSSDIQVIGNIGVSRGW